MPADEQDVRFSTGDSTPSVPEKRPYTLVLVSDFQAGDQLGGLTAIDKDDIAALLGRVRPTFALALKDPLGGGPDWEFQVAFDSFKAFEPAGLLAQTPGARWRLGVREKTLARQQGRATAGELDSALNTAADADASLAWLREVEAPAATDATVDVPEGTSVLDLVEEPDESARVKADVERLAAQAGDREGRLSAAEGVRVKKILERLDDELGRIADALLKHPQVRQAEAAWRGLKLLVERIDFREGVRLAELHAPREQAVSRLIEKVISPAYDGDVATPGMIMFDYPCANTPADLALLDELAQHAAGLPVPVTFPLEASFFNVKHLGLLKNLPNLPGLVDGWQFAKWKSLRDQPYSKSLVPVLGRFVLRAPYAAKPRAAEFSCTETVTGERDLLWGGGHLAVGLCAAGAYARHGWPTRMFGAQAGKVEDLPVVENPKDPGKPWGPGDLTLPDRRLDELPAVGINVLMSVKNKDHCILLGGVSAKRPVQTKDVSTQQAVLETSLPYQQFSNIAGAYLCEQLPSLRGLAAEEIQKQLLFGLANLLGVKEEADLEAVQVGVGPNPQDASQTLVQIRLTPPGRIVPGGLHIDFSFGL
jgi:type VI secretion system ImpC/EvpB family protein